MNLQLTVLKEEYTICRLPATSPIPDWAKTDNFFSITQTSDELSIVCLQKNVMDVEKVDKGWRMFKIEGPLDFSLVGILANLSQILANGGIGIFVISTFDTDYILVKKENLEKSINLFKEAGHTIQQ